MSRRPIKVSFIVNLLSPMTRIVVALVTVPLYLHHIGDARFGVMSIVWVLLGFFGFLDLGLSRAVTNALAKLSDAPQAHRARVLLTTFGLNSGIGVAGGIVLYVFGGLMLKHFISMPAEISAEVSHALPWIACLLPLTLISAAGAGALESRELFLLVNLIQIFAMTLAQVAPVVAAIFVSPSLAVVIPTAAVSQGLGAILVLVVVYRLEGPFSLRAVDWGEARKLLGYGGWMFATQVALTGLGSVDQFVIGSVMGVASVAHYAVPMSLVQRSLTIPVAFGRTLFPRMSSLSGDAAHVLGTRALAMMAYGFAAICAPAIILSSTFFRYWISADFAVVSAPVAQVLFPGMWMGALSMVGFTLLQSQGRADITGKQHIIEFLPFAAILWAATLGFGIVGAAAAWSLRGTADALVMLWLSGMKKGDFLLLLPPAALLAASLVLARFLDSNILINFAVAAFIGAASLVLGYLFSGDWRRLTLAQVHRARAFFLGGLNNRAKPISPVNTNAQKNTW
jgi:O-antigen/teichoic acid export membrane protein